MFTKKQCHKHERTKIGHITQPDLRHCDEVHEFTVNAKLIWTHQHSSTANFHKRNWKKNNNSEASLSLVFLVCQYLAAAVQAVEERKWKSKYILIIYCTKIREKS